jgi:hypothetical protein
MDRFRVSLTDTLPDLAALSALAAFSSFSILFALSRFTALAAFFFASAGQAVASALMLLGAGGLCRRGIRFATSGKDTSRVAAICPNGDASDTRVRRR